MADEAGSRQSTPHAPPEIELAARAGRGVGRLGPVLAWAVIFADLGTSVLYVPGILYWQVGGLAPAFVLMATFAFVLVALEHLEIGHRFPNGGGGVAAAVQAFGGRIGVVSGALMISAYLLTIAIAVVSALAYISALWPFPHEVELLSVVAILGLGLLNWIGIKELARLALVLSVAMLSVEAVLVFAIVVQLGPSDWAELWRDFGKLGNVPWTTTATGFAGAWLAYSGLESLGQMAPAVREPRDKVIRTTTLLVLFSVVITVPFFTAVAVEAAKASGIAPQGALLAPVALKYGGRKLLMALSLTGASLLLVAANVAFIGCYNVFRSVGEHGYLPRIVARRAPGTGVPRGAVVVITVGALLLVLGTRGNLQRLGNMFAFGLLGSYAITSVSLDVLRWREGRRGVFHVAGIVASLVLVVPWVTSWFTKPAAALYGAGVTAFQLLIALVTHRGWITPARFGYVRATSAEQAAATLPKAIEVLTLAEAVELRKTYPSTTLVALHGRNQALCREAARRAKGAGDGAVYVVIVDEIPGLLFPARTGPSDQALQALTAAVKDIAEEGVDAVPIWRLAHNAGAAIAEAAEQLGVTCVLVGTTHRSTVWHFLRGDTLKELVAELPDPVHVVICE